MKPWLLLPAHLAHDLSPIALELMSTFRAPTHYEWRPLKWRGLTFKNRLGIAGGVDKDGENIEAWWTYGPGFLEIGTVTPRPQGPNEGRIIDRDAKTFALWNRMGFPGRGVDHVRANLKDLPVEERFTPIFANIGKNRATSNEHAAKDYAECIDSLSGLVDAFVVNISSPNTTGLRELLQPANLRHFLGSVMHARKQSLAPQTPLLLKISPDLEEAEVEAVAQISASLGIDGFIATNTTLAREPGSRFPAEGGVSGRPLGARSKKVLSQLVTALGSARQDKLIVSVGGILTPDDVRERLDLGADLVQVYTALIYRGPGFFKEVATAMRKP